MKPHLENWSVTIRVSDSYKTPEQGFASIGGIVTGHSKITDGSPVQTSRILMLKTDKKIAKTSSGTEYSLGEIDPGFVKYLQKIKKQLSDYDFSE